MLVKRVKAFVTFIFFDLFVFYDKIKKYKYKRMRERSEHNALKKEASHHL
jgi:hypothetical protein